MGGLFGKPKQPKTQDPVRMPVEGDKDTAAMAERRRLERASASGRESTDLTSGSLGATDNTGLGG